MPVSSTHGSPQVLRIGTRDSKLALIQTHLVVELIQAAHPGLVIEVETMKTIGDKIQDFGDKGLFTKELETALEAKAINMIVHSLKDMPTHLPPNMKILAITEREDPRDAVIMHKSNQGQLLEDLPEGSVIGTGSVRRVAQLRRLYPHLRFADIRGNLTTRMAKLDAADSPFAALVLAVAGMRRQGMGARISQSLDAVLYAVGQGALGIEVLENDTDTQALLHGCLDHRATRLACLAERELMRRLEGGCSVPIGVTTAWCAADELRLCAVVEVRLQAQAAVASDADAERLGARLAQDMCAAGASRILAAIHHPPPPSAEVVAQAAVRK
ncbi:porphobilinogen deaminase [Kickxella alabastrina]|uniref:porphobilinogen deaminase n=1 Tax=Kickxella alabastrina TaxID=61397 RepID=UPI002220F506|nr:porphobilinogen deaminase [Kickxella alabastrina]KAI7823094.1 porphobilinogen deaminase [Kickxella alabastrina]